MEQPEMADVLDLERQLTEQELAIMWTNPERHYKDFDFMRFKPIVRGFIRTRYAAKVRRQKAKSKK